LLQYKQCIITVNTRGVMIAHVRQNSST